MDEKIYKRFDGDTVTDLMLEDASKLFSENYGVWLDGPGGDPARAGKSIRLTKNKLRVDYLPERISSYVSVLVNGVLAGNAFACRWSVDGKTICWVTQLVVHRDYRERGLAAGLLNELKMDGDDAYGVMSSHPAACLAASKAFGSSIHAVSLEYIKKNAQLFMKASPVDYVRRGQLRGSLFDSQDTSGLVSSVYTEFFVDHKEPLEALAWVRQDMEWPLGELFDGYEFVLILEARRPRSRSSSLHRTVRSTTAI